MLQLPDQAPSPLKGIALKFEQCLKVLFIKRIIYTFCQLQRSKSISAYKTD